MAWNAIFLKSAAKTGPPTSWFISETDRGIKLKIVFMFFAKEDEFVIKSAFAPNSDEIGIYKKYSAPSK